MKVFWSWQNDYEPGVCRHFIKQALEQATKTAGEELGLEDAERPEVDHDTKNTPGWAEIASTIFEKISRSAVFVADATPIGVTSEGKALPNPNVMVELGWAASELGPDRIIVVLNEASGYTPDNLPFDMRGRRTMTYNLPANADKKGKADAQKRLTRDLVEALKTNLGQVAEEQASAQETKGVPAKPDNPSIWSTASDRIEHNDSFGEGHQDSVRLIDGPRAYIRIIPSGWKNGPPSVSDIARLPDGTAVPAPSRGSNGSGSFGVCEEGFVRYWYTGNNERDGRATGNVAMFFDQTGEFWIIHGTVVSKGNHGAVLAVEPLVYTWELSLRHAMGVLSRFGAFPARRVEAGLHDVKGVRWPGRFNFESPPARKNSCRYECKQREWGEVARLNFVTDAYNKVRDLFGFAHASPEDVKKMLGP
ncbi:MAG: hypothetical protein ACOY4R_09455 [Pseudomonadota bacterium]